MKFQYKKTEFKIAANDRSPLNSLILSKGYGQFMRWVVCILLCASLLYPLQAGACGWAGDGEDDDDSDVITIGGDGKPVANEEQEDYAESLNKMGNRYRQGNGVTKNYFEAIRLYSMAARLSSAEAQNNLAAMYEQGLGVEKNIALTAKWYLESAKQGNEQAQHSIGQMYFDGRGVSQDFKEGANWLLKAAEQGHHSAVEQIGKIFLEGQGLQSDEERDELLGMIVRKMGPEKTIETKKALVYKALPGEKQTISGLYLTANEAFAKWQADPQGVKILDVRTKGEYFFVGHAPMAQNVPVKFLGTFNRNKSKPDMILNENFVKDVKKKFKSTDVILIMCRSGKRSALAANILINAGFMKIYSITDGFEGDKLISSGSKNNGHRVINGWKNSGKPWTYKLDPKLIYALND